MIGVHVVIKIILNIKGQPLLNDEIDVNLWEKTYNQKIIR